MVTVTFSASLCFISLFLGTPLKSLMGWTTCMFFYESIVFYTIALGVDGLGMAIFRLMCVKFPYVTHVFIGQHGLAALVLTFEAVLSSTFIYNYYQGFRASGRKIQSGMSLANSLLFILGIAVSLEFCSGESQLMREILWIYNGGTEALKKEGLSYQTRVIGLFMVLNLVEMGLYMILFWSIFKQDKSFAQKNVVSKDKVAARDRKNTITLTGQVLVFFVELFAAGFAGYQMNRKSESGIGRTAVPIMTSLVSTIISLINFVTSPELKKYYLPRLWGKSEAKNK